MSDAAIALRESGPGPGEAVLWLHGYTMNSSVWREHWTLLDGYRHLAVDLPGHGESAPLRSGQDLDHWSADLARIADQAEVRHLVALSFGGLAALAVAARMGDALRTLTLNSPAVPAADVDPQALSCNLALIRLHRDRGAGPWLTGTWLAWPHGIFAGVKTRPARWRELAAVIAEHRWSELADGSIHRMTIQERPRDLLRRVRADTLVVIGEDDIPAFKRAGQALVRGLPRVSRQYLTGCGHLAFLEEPARSAQIIRDHLSR